MQFLKDLFFMASCILLFLFLSIVFVSAYQYVF